MSLNIKNERTHALVRELAERTGQSQTSAVEEAVVRRLQEIEAEAGGGDSRRARVDMLLGEIHRGVTPEVRAAILEAERGLYDDAGLPK